MTGISGIIGKINPELAKEQLFSMIKSMNTETFYRKGVYFNEKVGIYLGWSVYRIHFRIACQ